MKQFQTGKDYSCRSVCDHDCIFTVTVLKRTAKTVTVDVHGRRDLKNKRLGIRVWDNAESINPLGSYSMAPIIRAA